MSTSSDLPLSILNNKYVVTRSLGNGGFGEVYEAYDPRLGTHYAVKIVHCETEEKRRQVTREAKLLAQHSKKLRFLPDVYDVWDDGQKAHLAMEFIDGPTLHERMEQSARPWPANQVEAFLRTLLTYLHQLHDAGIIHRDLKPSNIKDHPQRGYVLLDFGIAKQFETYSVVREVGTVEYSPLEQLTQGGRTDPRSDLFSLGATAYQLLTRQLPLPAYLRESARHNGQGEVLVRPSQHLGGGVPPALERTILALLALDAADRPLNARAALALLDTVPTDTVISPPTPKRPTPPPLPPTMPPAAPTVALRQSPATVPVTSAAAPLALLARFDPRALVQRRLAVWQRDLWRPTSATTLIYTGLWLALGGLIGWAAGWAVMTATVEGRTLLFPFLGMAVSAGCCFIARLLALPKGHPAEANVALAGLYVGGMALVGALVGGLYTIFDDALRRQDGTVTLGAAFAPLLGVVAILLLHSLRTRAADALRRVGTGTIFIGCSAALIGMAIGGLVGSILWLIPQGSAGNFLSDCLVPGALGGGLVGAACGLYLGAVYLLLRESEPPLSISPVGTPGGD